MKSCAPLRLCSACTPSSQGKAWTCVANQNARYSSTKPYIRKSASPIIPESSPDPVQFDIDTREKKINTEVGELPLSPMMDPSYWEAKNRHTTKKAPPGKPQNLFEEQLRANPFAHALGAPIRQCAVTKTRLPKALLQGFNIVLHPETGKPWWYPRLPAPKPPPKSKKGIEAGNELVEGGEKHETEKSSTSRNDPSLFYGPGAHMLSRHDLISAFAKPRSAFSHDKYHILGQHEKFEKISKRTVWREDMATLILDRMRQVIADELISLAQRSTEDDQKYIIGCQGWDDVPSQLQGSILWFEDPDAPSVSDTSQPGLSATHESTLPRPGGGNASMAVHNMPMLLGDDHVARLREDAMFKNKPLFVLTGPHTVDVQVLLWRLQGYIDETVP
ncbi:hypothetical protein GGS20DRAFT_545805 [Poronia punctata]|nr:hypothetical protein GGS20DRAFT_545805 [Poronia punctata]